jgi:glycosyltransferase involved in cell wall biosynthesis
MRIVFISTMSSAPWGGSEELWSRAAARLCEHGHEIAASVVWWPQPSPRLQALAAAGIRLRVRKPAPSVVDLWWPRHDRIDRWWIEELAWVPRQKPDLAVISQGGNADGASWMKYCRDAGVPFVVIVQCNAEAWWPSDQTGSDADLTATLHAARMVFCVSRHNLELMERQIGACLPNARVIWNPYNVSAEPPPAWPAADDGARLACVARLEPSAKGQDLLFQVLASPAWRERPLEVNLYGDGPCEHNLQQLAQYLRLANVRFAGHVKDVAGIWEDNHALVLPSRLEGLPLALVEAMWCGRPAVVTDVGGNAELCVDEETGFVAGAPTVDLFAQAMERAWARRFDWPRMGAAARARAERLIPRDPVGIFCQHLLEDL